jgi:hypothetical protein
MIQLIGATPVYRIDAYAVARGDRSADDLSRVTGPKKAASVSSEANG